MELGEQREGVKKRAEEEKNRVKGGGEPWGVYDSSLKEYLDSFEDVLPPEGISKFLASLSEKRGRKLRALDVAGQGHALLGLKEFGIGLIAAITLVDFRKNIQKISDFFKGLTVTTGDVSTGTTWKKLGEDKFDFIVCRPVAAAEILDPVTSLAVLDRMYQSLEEDGLLLTQIPEGSIKYFGTNWIEKLSQTRGLEVHYSRGKRWRFDDRFLPELSIIRRKNAPPNLRFLAEVSPDSKKQVEDIQTHG